MQEDQGSIPTLSQSDAQERRPDGTCDLERLRIARLLIEEGLRERRAYRSGRAQVGRAIGGVWRSIVSGGWD